MTEDTTIEASTALALPNSTEILPLFTKENGTEPLIAQIEAAVAEFTPNTKTAKGRDEIRAMAFKVTKSKTALVGIADQAKEDAARVVKAVNAETKRIKERLDALRDKTRQPLTDWEAAEEDRKNREAELLGQFNRLVDPNQTATELKKRLAEVEDIVINESYGQIEDQARIAKDALIEQYKPAIAAAAIREKEAAELEELRVFKAKQEAEAAERERVEREKAQAEEAERIAKERAEADRIATERAAAERKAAEARAAEAARLEVEERHAKELADAKAREDRAAQAERDRIAAERQAEEQARAKREADLAHRNRIADSITKQIRSLEVAGDLDPEAVTHALMKGEIAHVRVVL